MVVIEAVLVCIDVHIVTRVSGVSSHKRLWILMDISWILTRTQDRLVPHGRDEMQPERLGNGVCGSNNNNKVIPKKEVRVPRYQTSEKMTTSILHFLAHYRML